MATKKTTKKKTTADKAETKKKKDIFEQDIIDFLRSKENKLGIDVGFLTETGANVKYWLDTSSYTWNFISSGRFKDGLPFGRIAEVFGDPYTGKSVMACHLAVKGQQEDAIVVYFDPEHGVDVDAIERLGGDPSTIIAPKGVKTIEDFDRTFIKIVEKLAMSDNERPIIVILDSLAMLSTDHEIKEPDKADYTKAKKIRQFFRKYMDDCARYNILLFVVNQVYDNIGVMYGPKKKATGGQGLTYASSQRYDLKAPTIERDEGVTSDVIGTRVKAKAIKNRMSVPFRSAYVRFTYKDGIDRYGGLFELLSDGDNKTVTGFNIIKRGKKNEKTKEWEPHKTGKYYIWEDVVVDENGKTKGFTRKEFVNVLQEKEDYYMEKAQEHIDMIKDDLLPDINNLTEEEKILAGIDGDHILTDRELLEREIKDMNTEE